MWRSNEPSISLRDLTAEVVATLTRLAERRFSDDQAAHSIASGSLLTRPNDDAFTFIHRSVMEWLVAAHAARELKDSGDASMVQTRQMSRLMAAFLTDLAGHHLAREWAARTLADPEAPEAARQNALAVNARLPRAAKPERQDLSGLDLRSTDLTGRELRGAILRDADLRGMRLTDVNLDGADLTGADLRGIVLTGGSMRGAMLAGSRWKYAALLGNATDGIPGELAPAAIVGRDRAEATTEGLSGHVNWVAFSPDGALLAYGSDKVVKIADAATGRTVRVLRGHLGIVYGIAFSPDGTRIATASRDNTARTWDVTDIPGIYTSRMDRILRRRAVPSIEASITLRGHHDTVNDVIFDPSGTRILSASDDGTIRTWRLPDATSVHVLTGHDGPVVSIALHHDGRFLASASADGTVRIWSMETLQTIATLISLPEGGYATLLPDGSYKLDGDPGDRIWWAMKLCRFAPGELDPHVPEIRRLPADAPILRPA